jgi:hypothetical protein
MNIIMLGGHAKIWQMFGRVKLWQKKLHFTKEVLKKTTDFVHKNLVFTNNEQIKNVNTNNYSFDVSDK